MVSSGNSPDTKGLKPTQFVSTRRRPVRQARQPAGAPGVDPRSALFDQLCPGRKPGAPDPVDHGRARRAPDSALARTVQGARIPVRAGEQHPTVVRAPADAGEGDGQGGGSPAGG